MNRPIGSQIDVVPIQLTVLQWAEIRRRFATGKLPSPKGTIHTSPW